MAVFKSIEAAHFIDQEAVFEAMLDSPATRRHQILPPTSSAAGGLWLGNQVAAGGMVPVADRTSEYLAETLEQLRHDGIGRVLCLAEGLECYTGELEYMQIRIADHGDRRVEPALPPAIVTMQSHGCPATPCCSSGPNLRAVPLA